MNEAQFLARQLAELAKKHEAEERYEIATVLYVLASALELGEQKLFAFYCDEFGKQQLRPKLERQKAENEWRARMN